MTEAFYPVPSASGAQNIENGGTGNITTMSGGSQYISPGGNGTAWLRDCDVVVAECTQVSLGVGYELAYAEAHGKEVHIFYRPKETQLSAMLAGNECFHIHRYADEAEILAQVRHI